MTKANMAKYANEDIVMKGYVLLQGTDTDLSTKTVREKMEAADWTEKDVERLDAVFNVILHAYQQIKDKKVKKKIVTRIHFISLIPLIDEVLKNGLITEEEMIQWMQHFFDDKYKSASISDKYNECVGAGSARREAVVTRFEEMENDIREFMKK